MENPIKQLRIATKKQRFVIGLQILLLLVVSSALLFSPFYFEEKKKVELKEIVDKNSYLFNELNLLKETIKKNEEEIKKRDEELKKFKSLSKLIQIRIKEVNKNISANELELYANHIIKISREENINPLLHTELIVSESSFNKNVKHAISDVRGLTGVYAKWWVDELTTAGIIKHRGDLDDPLINIAAGAYILKVYINQHKSLETALTKYKGEGDLAANQARRVILATAKLQARGNLLVL